MLACAMLLLAASSPPTFLHYASTPGEAARTSGLDDNNMKVVRTNSIENYAVVVLADAEDYRTAALVERFSLGWQVIDYVNACTLAARGIGASDRATLLAGVPASAQTRSDPQGCSAIDLADRGSAADVASIRKQLYSSIPLVWYFVATYGDFAAAYQPKTNPTYYHRAGGVWKKLIGGSSDEGATEAQLHAVGLSDEALCALGRCEFFHSPTGNTGCNVRDVSNDGPGGHFRAFEHACNGKWGRGYELGATGKPTVVCADDSVLDRGGIIDYGMKWYTENIDGATTTKLSCTSRTIGLTCTNGTGHGFFIARGESRMF